MPVGGRECFSPAVDGTRFLLSSRVSGIHNYNEHSSREKERRRLLKSGKSGIRPGNARLVTTGKITEIENSCPERPIDTLLDPFMAGVDQFDTVDQTCFAQ